MESELLSSQLAVAYATSSFIEWLKHKPWFPFVGPNTAQLNRFAAVIGSFLAAVGVHIVSDWQATDGVLVITISGLSIANAVHVLMAWAQQYAMTQAAYKGLVKK